MVDSLILNSQPMALSLVPEGSLSHGCIFSARHITAFSRSGHASTSGLHVGAILNSKISKKKYRHAKNMALSRPQKDTRLQHGSGSRGQTALNELAWERGQVSVTP